MSLAVNIGIDNRSVIAEKLSRYLASSYTLYLKTQNFHWNVTGPHFHALHVMFEEQYTELAASLDIMAERIRALGYRAPASYSEYEKLSEIAEQPKDIKAMHMVKELLSDHQRLARMGRELVELAEQEDDNVSGDMIIERVESHDKVAWMLRSTLE